MRPEPARGRVTITGDGPVLVPGPVDVVTPDGTVVRSDRPVTAICVCGRSSRYPFCDTSHRERTRSSRVDAPSGRPTVQEDA